MTIKKQWLLVLVLIAICSVMINTLVLSTLTNQYFKGYMKNSYERNQDKIIEYTTRALNENDSSINQLAIELEAQIVDPITRIKVYNQTGNLILDISADIPSVDNYGNRRNGMMNGMMGRMIKNPYDEVDHINIMDGETIIGQVNIMKYSSVENSNTTWMFQTTLLKNSVYSVALVLAFAIFIGIIVSKKVSKDLENTAELAQSIDIGTKTNIELSKIKEIRVIQQSLESLQYRLKLKQKSRKTLIDELLHQVRTPLTIMKTHLEGVEDGIIEMTPEEIKICENQIDNITTIVTNMSNMIDAEKQDNIVKIEEFEFSQLVKQIVSGLKVQFDKKNIDLTITEHKKVILQSDKYKLSQAIYNILTNAYKFTRPEGTVKLSYEIISDKLRIMITDNGPGIAAEEQSKIFDAYYKKNILPNTAGEGIGLFVVKENIASIKGTIQVESKINQGSKFILDIPMDLK